LQDQIYAVAERIYKKVPFCFKVFRDIFNAQNQIIYGKLANLI